MIEWPGGEPSGQPITVPMERQDFKRFFNGQSSAWLPATAPLEQLAALPVGTLVDAVSGSDRHMFPSFPVQPCGKRWYLEELCGDHDVVKPNLSAIARWRKAEGYATRRV